MTPIEKVARALCEADGRDPEERKHVSGGSNPLWVYYQEDARAAIQALAEPADDLVASAIAAAVHTGELSETGGTLKDYLLFWQSMISSCLGEKG